MKVLILHPDFRDPGGVAAYYYKLKDKFTLPMDHFITGQRPQENVLLSKLSRMIYDYARFVMLLRKNRYDLVHVNPSLDPKSFLRDGIFLLVARMCRKKTIAFFHGWQKIFESRLERYGLWVYKFLYGKTNAFIVLSEEVKKIHEGWGFTHPIYREVTVTEDDDLEGFDIHKTISERQVAEKWRVLFISRIVKEKGIYETIKAVFLLQDRYPMIELIIAGDGDELDSAKTFVNKNAIPNVIFTGYVKGKEKKRLFKSAHIFCYPTYYGEGLPLTVTESMSFGLPVLTRPVGGIADFFKNRKHGFLTHSKNPKVFADFIERLFLDEELYKRISLFNYRYAQRNFLASQAALRLEQIYENVLMN